MAREFYYLPVERYASRWTEYVSGLHGMFGECVEKAGATGFTIQKDNDVRQIKSGIVLDTQERAEFGFWQVERILHLIQKGSINDSSVIYIEDFWLPGMEMIPYACNLAGIKPRVYAFCHAQSVDPNDFTAKMLPWIRGFEVGWAKWLAGIFVAAKELKEMLLQIAPAYKIHVCGTVFNRDVLIRDYYPGMTKVNGAIQKRKPLILFTGRHDKEKDPQFFVNLSKYAKEQSQPWKFYFVSGKKFLPPYPNMGYVDGWYEDISKATYFRILSEASVMVNASKQDFVGYCTLDALAYGCVPLLPDYLTFPDVMNHQEQYLYEPGNVESAYRKLCVLMEAQSLQDECTVGVVPALYTEYGAKYEQSVAKMLEVMFG